MLICRFVPTVPTWQGPSRSIWMARRLRLSLLLADRFIGIRRRVFAEFLNHGSRLFRLVLTHHDDHTAYSGINVLGRVQTLNIRVDACRLQQALYHHRLGFLLGIKYLD